MDEYGVVTEPGTVRIQRVLPGPIERVWDYLTDPEKRGLWLARGPMEPRVGGRVELAFDNAGLSPDGERAPEKHRAHECTGSSQGEVTVWEPPYRLAYTWSGGSEVSFELAPEGREVRLVLTHQRLAGRGQVLRVAAGWRPHVGLPPDLLPGPAPGPLWSTHTRLEREYDRLLPAA